MEIIVDPHESLVDELGSQILLDVGLTFCGKLNLLSRSDPVHIELAICFFGLGTHDPQIDFFSLFAYHLFERLPINKLLEVILLCLGETVKEQLSFHKLNFDGI